MANVYTHMPMDQQIVSFANQRLYELKREQRGVEAEIAMWMAVIDRMGLCKTCHGEGKVRHQIAQDESEMETCPTCKGTGKA